jgi:hypothetical protein
VRIQDHLFEPTHLLMRNDFVRYVRKNPYASVAASDKKETILTDGSARTPFECFPQQQIWLLGTEWHSVAEFF